MIDDLTPAEREALDALRASRGPCPSAATLVEYESLSAADRERHRDHAHIVTCSRCQLALHHLQEPARSSAMLRWVLPIAAVAVLAVSLTIVSRSVRSAVAPGAETDPTVRGTEIQIVAPAGAVDRLSEFAWQSPIRGERYRVTVMREGKTVWTTETAAQRVEAPRDVLERNVEYRWRVEAIDREGEVRMTSPPQSFSIR